MNNVIISAENVTRPEVLSNALQRTEVVVEIHRAKSGWDYKAVQSAMAYLTVTAFQLYVYLEGGIPGVPWTVWPSKVEKATQLNEYTLLGAVLELKKKGFLTPGKIEWDGQMYETNVFHFWESPELCYIEYDEDAA